MSLPFDPSFVALVAVAWAVTYALHSTVLLCGAWLLERRYGDRPELMSPIWKIAVLGGAFSATLQLSAGLEPIGGRWAVAAEERAAEPLRMTSVVPAVMGRLVVRHALAPVAEVPMEVTLASTSSTPMPAPIVEVAPDFVAPRVAAQPQWTTPARAAIGIFVLWIIGGVVALIGLVRSWLALRRVLRGRLALRSGVLADTFARLHARAGGPKLVRLSVSSTVRVPLATGVMRPEIVVPKRALRELGPAAQESMLAHELGHVVRRDPSWRLFVAVVERVLFFQPLLRVASRRIAQHAEYLADAWAARHTAEPLALARCLTEIATWLRAAPVSPGLSLASSMAEPASILGRRVLRLVEPAPAPKRRSGAALALATTAVVALAWIAPVASWAHDEPRVIIDGVAIVHGGDDDGDEESAMVVIDSGRAQAELDALQHREASRAAAARHRGDDSATAKGRRPAKKAERAATRDRAAARRDARRDIDREFRRAKRKGELPDADRIAAIVARAQSEADADRQRGQVGARERRRVHVKHRDVRGHGNGLVTWVRDEHGNVIEIRVSGNALEQLGQLDRLQHLDHDIARALHDAKIARHRVEIERARARAHEEVRRHRALRRGHAPRAPRPPRAPAAPPFTFDIVPIAPMPAPAPPMPPMPPEAFVAPMPVMPDAPVPPMPMPVVAEPPGFAPPAPPARPVAPRAIRHRGPRAPKAAPSA